MSAATLPVCSALPLLLGPPLERSTSAARKIIRNGLQSTNKTAAAEGGHDPIGPTRLRKVLLLLLLLLLLWLVLLLLFVCLSWLLGRCHKPLQDTGFSRL